MHVTSDNRKSGHHLRETASWKCQPRVDPDLFEGRLANRELNRETVVIPAIQNEQLARPELAAANAAEVPPAAVESRGKLRLFTVLAALFSALFISALNATIVATAVPTICSALHCGSGYAWVGGAELLGNAAASPIWVKVSDIWGRKPVLVAATAGYFASSLLCALSTNMSMLIAGRALQGVAGGGLSQLVNITISDLFSMRRRALLGAMTEVVWVLAGGLGPILGGTFTQLISWRWIFWINLPVAGMSCILIAVFLDVHDPKTKTWDGLKAIDWAGSFSFLGFMLMFLLGLDFGGAIFPWSSSTVICLIVFGVTMSAVFVFSEIKVARYPMMPMNLFRNQSNVASIVVGTLQEFTVACVEFYLPLLFQAAFEDSPIRSGVLLMPLMLAQAGTGILSGIIIHQTGRYRENIWVGVVLLAVGQGLYIRLNALSSLGDIIGAQLVAGIGGGLLFLPPLIALQAHVSQDDTATAIGTLGFTRNFATAISVIVGGVVVQNGMQHQASALVAAGVPAHVRDKLLGGNAAANFGVVRDIADAGQRLAVKQAYAASLRNVWIMVTAIAGISVVASLFIQKRELSREHTETKTGIKKAAPAAVEL